MKLIYIHNTAIFLIESISYSGQNKMTVFIVLHFVKSFVLYRSVFTQCSYYRDFFRFGPVLRLCYRHRHVGVRYFDTTKITVSCMSSILTYMTYFSVYTR